MSSQPSEPIDKLIFNIGETDRSTISSLVPPIEGDLLLSGLAKYVAELRARKSRPSSQMQIKP